MADEKQISLEDLGRGRMAIQLVTPERRKAFRSYLDTLGLSNEFNTQNATIIFRKKDLTHILAATAQILSELDERNLLTMHPQEQSLSFSQS